MSHDIGLETAISRRQSRVKGAVTKHESCDVCGAAQRRKMRQKWSTPSPSREYQAEPADPDVGEVAADDALGLDDRLALQHDVLAAAEHGVPADLVAGLGLDEVGARVVLLCRNSKTTGRTHRVKSGKRDETAADGNDVGWCGGGGGGT